jgi:hypothetical protein
MLLMVVGDAVSSFFVPGSSYSLQENRKVQNCGGAAENGPLRNTSMLLSVFCSPSTVYRLRNTLPRRRG